MKEIKLLPSNWRSVSPLEIVNTTRTLPCGSCGKQIYALRAENSFSSGDTIMASDFEALGEWPNPTDGSDMKCPLCKRPMMVIGEARRV